MRRTVWNKFIQTLTASFLKGSHRKTVKSETLTLSYRFQLAQEIALVKIKNSYHLLSLFLWKPFVYSGHKFAILEMKTVISTILRSFKLLPVAGKTKIQPLFRITLRAKGGLWVRLEPRNNNNNNLPSKQFNETK